MKAAVRFIKATITGGVLFMIPVVILFVVVKKALNLLKPITDPWDVRLKDEIVWGLDGHNLVGILMLIILCFIAGIIFQLSIVRRYINLIELKLLSYFPGYTLIKSLASEALGDSDDTALVPVLVKDGDTYRAGFLSEQRGDLCTVFLPEVPEVNAGELQIIPAGSVIRLSISNRAMKRMMRNLGQGIVQLVIENRSSFFVNVEH